MQQYERQSEMVTELQDVAMAIVELRRMRDLTGDLSYVTRVGTLLRHFELLLLDMVEHRLQIR